MNVQILAETRSPDAGPLDISLILNLHREANYLRRTMLSVEQAVSYARMSGISFELVVVLDNSDDATRAEVARIDRQIYDSVVVIEVSNGSLGLSRNSGIEASSGRYIATADADDLVSRNMYLELYKACQDQDAKTCAFAEWYFAFGDNCHLGRYLPSNCIPVTEYMDQHPYVSRIMFPRGAAQRVKYEHLPSSGSYAYEDWHFNCELIAAGYRFLIARDTVLYYRQRAASLMKLASGSTHLIPNSTLFRPDLYERLAAADSSTDAETRRHRQGEAEVRTAFVANPLIAELNRAANEIEPAIVPFALSNAHCFTNHTPYNPIGDGYYSACRHLGETAFDEVFLLPFITTGGGEKYVLNIATALAELNPNSRQLFLFGECADQHHWLDRLPNGSVFLDLAMATRTRDQNAIDVLTLRIIQNFAPNARVHVKPSVYTDRFLSRFGKILENHKIVYYRFCDEQIIANGQSWKLGWGFNYLSENLGAIDLVVTDNASLLAEDQNRFGAAAGRWRLLYTHCDSVSSLRRAKRSKRLLWASRLTSQKRPELLAPIARRLRALVPDVVLDVYGRVDEGIDTAELSGCSNIRLLGAYERFADLAPESYDALIYTSAYDGLPNVILEALGAGLPVVAADVGGVGEAVIDGVTGHLVTGTNVDDLAAAYAQAVEVLYRDPRPGRMRENARVLVAGRHGWSSFVAAVAAVFQPSQDSLELVA